MKKGQIFSIDMMLAIVVVMIVIGSSAYFFTNTEEDFMNYLQMVKTGDDITVILEKDGTIDRLSSGEIRAELNAMLPVNYEMRLRINTTLYPEPIIIETESQMKEGSFIATGKRFFVFKHDNAMHAGSIQYEVWPK
ncbi:MAG: hypothetical protein V1906_02485 [Candidatus Woesearchaeota archaeon]